MEQNPVVIVNEYRAQQAKAEHDYAKAIEYSAIARDAALSDGDKWAFHRSSFNIAHFQYALGRMDDCIRTIEELVEHAAMADYPELVAQARTLLAHALQNSGATDRALTAAEEAASVIPDEPGQLRLALQHSIVSTLAEKGESEDAWREALVLDTLVGPESGTKVRGMAYWAIGNAGFMSGRITEGQEYHDRAAIDLVRVGDVNLWALFNKAAANMRLEAGLINSATLECVERAEVAISVAGGNVADKVEILLARAHWEYASGNLEVAENKLREVAAQTKELFPYIRAQSLQLLSGCLLQAGRKGEALKVALESEQIFLETGGAERAFQVRTFIDTMEAAREQ
ncbi:MULTISPECIES: hypothetical protein [unclassified Arthrobacter]|uniref:hypothetical protein n=1 Tax=unclassified Arthrobacter TaxID=235627 RepID=UPI001E2E1C46|nr:MULTISPECIES: hypothetical protein [unclassified Arthrobacter]MCC9178992.1 hypothetical protein [Arthrobacter sp. zg-Y750]MDK1328443.1 hypothetical protein [Arthrobacter sp. zg-Y1143]